MSNRYGDTSDRDTGNVWAVSVLVFAAMLLLLDGILHVIQGIAALLDDGYIVTARHYAFSLDTTTWGWVSIVNGIILVVSGIGLMFGAIWARLVVLVLVVITGLINFVFIPSAPIWSIIMLLIDGAIIWAIITVPTVEDP